MRCRASSSGRLATAACRRWKWLQAQARRRCLRSCGRADGRGPPWSDGRGVGRRQPGRGAEERNGSWRRLGGTTSPPEALVGTREE
eukprot:15460070-Alexandrium_andersonii.AAC.1